MPDLNSKELKKIFKSYEPNLLIKDLDQLKELFEISMERAYKIFGTYSFRRALPGERRTPVNKTLFEVWGSILATMPKSEYELLITKKKRLLSKYRTLSKDDNFIRYISRDSWKFASVENRYKNINAIITEVMDEIFDEEL